MSQMNNPCKKKKVGHNMLVLAHMHNNPACICPRCVAAAEAREWNQILESNPELLHFDNDDQVLVADDDDGSLQAEQPPPPPNNRFAFVRPPPSTPRRTPAAAPPAATATPAVTPDRPKNPANAPIGGVLVPVSFGAASSAAQLRTFTQQLPQSITSVRFVGASNHSTDVVGPIAAANPFAQSAIDELESLGINSDSVLKNTTEIFSQVVHLCLLAPMRHLGVNHLSTAADFCPVNESAENKRMINQNHKGSFFFVPLMIQNKTVSLINSRNEAEFFHQHNQKICNRKFWEASLDIKRKSTGGFFKTLELGALMPEWTVAECFKHQHQDAMQWMASNAAVLPNKSTMLLSLKQECATVFLRNMQSELVAKARLAGFQPLFLIKNAIVQKTGRFGINGHQISTINLQPKSCLALVAFFRGSGDDLQIITLKNEEEEFMVIDNNTNNH